MSISANRMRINSESVDENKNEDGVSDDSARIKTGKAVGTDGITDYS